ncbi:MAG: hypothetical protein LBT09_07020 [Planctomycetaceae bacterium]|nr:hypothetical protein [Planctomycetaceae bacterium]
MSIIFVKVFESSRISFVKICGQKFSRRFSPKIVLAAGEVGTEVWRRTRIFVRNLL